MAADIQSLRPYLQDFDLTGLMVEELGWNHHRGAPRQLCPRAARTFS